MTRRTPLRPTFVVALTAALAMTAQAQDEQVVRLRAALAAPERPAESKARDEARKPVETIQFFGIETGDTVVELIAVGGWFTEVLSAAVGPSGKVYASNPPGLVPAEAEKALHDRLGNVEAVHGSLAEANVSANADVAFTAQNLHDLYFGYRGVPGSEAIAVDFLKAVHAGLKPGGVLALIDHVGVAGQDNGALHRIEVQQARDVITKAGFTIEAESSLLANPADDHTKIVVDPSIRGRTDQFMIRARKAP